MKAFIIIPFTAFFISFFLWSYVFITGRETRAGRAYLIYGGNVALWQLFEFIIWSITSAAQARLLYRILSPVPLACGFLFLYFTCTLTGRKRDAMYYIFMISLAAGVILALSTDLFLDITSLGDYRWGYFPGKGPLYVPVIAVIALMPMLYALGLLAAGLIRTGNTDVKKQYGLVISGATITLVLVLIENIFDTWSIDRGKLPYLTASFFMIQSVFVFVAVVRYRLLTVPVQQVAYDLFSRINDAVIITDNSGGILEMNTSARELLDLPGDRESPKTADDIFPPDFTSDGEFREREITLFRGGARKTFSVSQSLLIERGAPAWKMFIMRNITERKQSEELMLNQNELGTGLSGVTEIKQSAELIVDSIIKLEGIDCAGIYVRDGQSRSFNLIYSRGLSRNFAEKMLLITADNPHPITDLFTATQPGYLDAGMIAALPASAILLDEGLRSVLMIPILYREQPLSWICASARGRGDITDQSRGAAIAIASQVGNAITRIRAEMDLLKSSKIESLGIFAGGIAHDFNNLLTSIIGNISLAKLDLEENEGVFSILTEAERASLQAKDLTVQLLTFSRGGEPIRKTESIADLLSEKIDFILRGSGILCRYLVADGLRRSDIDRGQIGQVIHNIVLNARQAMPSGGTITITAGNVTLPGQIEMPLKPGDYVRISIADQGDGIPPNYINKIFDPYFTTRASGSGLGLAVSYSIIRNHNGHIAVRSEPGRGTTFDIYIPASTKDEKAQAHTDAGREKRVDAWQVLLMDDDQMILDVGAKILKRLGHRVTCARNGEEAIALYRDAESSGARFDLVIMDLTVPGGMGGLETIKALKKINNGVRAVVSSGYSNNPVMANYRDYGFCGVIAKPYRYTDLENLLEDLGM
jgi:signal transduction histidine kinase/CheY-like chemotaxis protein